MFTHYLLDTPDGRYSYEPVDEVFVVTEPSGRKFIASGGYAAVIRKMIELDTVRVPDLERKLRVCSSQLAQARTIERE